MVTVDFQARQTTTPHTLLLYVLENTDTFLSHKNGNKNNEV